MSGGRVGKVVLLGGPGSFGSLDVGSSRFERTEPPTEFLDRNDRARDARRENVRAGLDPAGYATYQTSRSRGAYDPSDPADVQRVRKIVALDDGAEAAEAWEPHRRDPDPGTEDNDVEPGHRCHVCGAHFPTEPPLRRHLELHHPGAEPPPPPEPEEPEAPAPAPDEPYVPEPAIGRDEGYDGRVMPWHGFRGV